MSLFTAIEDSIKVGLDPNASLTREYVQTVTKEKAEDVAERQLSTIGKIQAALAKAVEDKAPQEVIGAYNKLLARYS